MSSPTSNQNDSVFLKSIVPDCGEDVTHKRRENKVKLSLMTFNNLRSSAKSLLSAGKFGEAIVAYTQALDTVVRIVNVEVGQAAEVEQAEEEEIARQQAETARWDKFNSTNGAKPVVLATEPIEEESNDNNNVISGSIDLVLNKFLSLRGKSYNGSKEASPILFKAQDFSTSREANPAYKSANGDYSGARYRNGGTRKGFSLALSPEQVRQNREKYSN